MTFSREATPSAGAVGEAMERLAESFLLRQGLRCIARNHRCRYGEIDLILCDDCMLVFAEVRFRRSARFGSPAETVDRRKQRRLIATANHYLQSHPSKLPCRFDVVAIRGQHEIQWIKHAFTADPG